METAQGPPRPGAARTQPGHDNTKARQYAQTVSEEEVFETSKGHSFCPYFAHPPDRPLVWVKFGDSKRQAEGETQMLAWRWAQRVNNPAISIPEVYKIFSRGRRTFIIMQLLDAEPLNKCVQYPASDCYDLVAEGIQMLRRMPVPDDATPGPYSRDPKLREIHHPLFKDHQASTIYRNVDELETHIQRVATRSYRKAGPQHHPTVTFERELVFCYCDLNDENFMFNTDSSGRLRLYIVDFEHASFLPVTFLAYALFVEARDTRRWITAEPLIQRIGHTLSRSNLDVLTKVHYSFAISASHIDLVKVGVGASATWRVSPSDPAPTEQVHWMGIYIFAGLFVPEECNNPIETLTFEMIISGSLFDFDTFDVQAPKSCRVELDKNRQPRSLRHIELSQASCAPHLRQR